MITKVFGHITQIDIRVWVNELCTKIGVNQIVIWLCVLLDHTMSLNLIAIARDLIQQVTLDIFIVGFYPVVCCIINKI